MLFPFGFVGPLLTSLFSGGTLVLGTALIVVVACSTIDVIREKARERARQKNLSILTAKVKEKIKNPSGHNVVNIGLRDSSDNEVDSMTIEAEDIDDDVYTGQIIIM